MCLGYALFVYRVANVADVQGQVYYVFLDGKEIAN